MDGMRVSKSGKAFQLAFDAISTLSRILQSAISEKHASFSKLANEFRRIAEEVAASSEPPTTVLLQNPGEGLEHAVELTLENLQVTSEALEAERDSAFRAQELALPMLFVYLHALFDGYLSNILVECIVSKPEVLTSRKAMVTYETLLKHRSFDEVLLAIAEREAYDVTFQSIENIREQFKERFGITLSADKERFRRLQEAKGTRNLYVHNSGKVSRRYLADFPESALTVGALRVIDLSYMGQAMEDVRTTVAGVDRQAVSKFSLPPG